MNSVERLKTTLENVQARLRSPGRASPMTDAEKALSKEAKKARKEFEKVMDNNLDTPKGLKTIHELSRALNKYLDGEINDGTLQEAFDVYKLLLDTYGLFAGLTGGTSSGGEETLNHLMQFVVELRDEARKNKDYATSDKIRDKLNELNIVLEDSPKGTIWKIKN